MGARNLGPAAKRRFKNDIYSALARVPAAISNPHRLELLELLAQRPRTVADAAAEVGLTIANASQHLQVLSRSGLVEVERHGTFAFYRTAGAAVHRLLVTVHDVAERYDSSVEEALRKHLGSREEGITDFAQARALIVDPRVVLLDARPCEEFAAGHLPSAINAPFEALKAGKIALPRSKRYLVYCRGPFCIFADEVVALLRERGMRATRLALGPADWEAAGEAIERAG